MDITEIATKKDVKEATAHIISFVKEALQIATSTPPPPKKIKFLRSRDVKEMLGGISNNKLMEMREKGEIPFTKRGATYFYPEDEFIKSMNDDLNISQP